MSDVATGDEACQSRPSEVGLGAAATQRATG